MYGSTTKGDVVKRSDCILVYGSTTKGGVVKRSDCILLYGSTTNGGVVKRSDYITVFTSALPPSLCAGCVLESQNLQKRVILGSVQTVSRRHTRRRNLLEDEACSQNDRYWLL